jgi:Protein of unknown function (DUF3750)
MLKLVLAVFLLLLAGPIVWAAATRPEAPPHWSAARWGSSGLAPDPRLHPGAIVQIYAARTWGWKGIFAVHSWLAYKAEGADAYERYDVTGWGVRHGRPAVQRNLRSTDGFWAGSAPMIVAELRGAQAAAAIPKIEAAIEAYPYPDSYLSWPGPNSNTFVAWVLRSVPELGAELPPTAIGKDFLPSGQIVATAPSGTGVQLSLFGILGLTLAGSEGFELNILGLVLGVDPGDLALKLPAIGRIGLTAPSATNRPAPPPPSPSSDTPTDLPTG